MDDLELMRSVAAGDGRSIQGLIDEHYDSVYRFLRHLTRSREDAEDLTQDVFLTARSKGSSFQGVGTVRSWLIRVAINAHAKHCRRERLRRICHLTTHSKQDSLDSFIDSEWLLSGIEKLPREQQIALLLFDVQGFSVREIASATGCPEGTVKARLHHARKRLHQLLICPHEE